MLVRIVLFNFVTSDRRWVSAGEGREGKLGDQFILYMPLPVRVRVTLSPHSSCIESVHWQFSFFNSTGLGEFYDLVTIMVVSRASVLVKGRSAAYSLVSLLCTSLKGHLLNPAKQNRPCTCIPVNIQELGCLVQKLYLKFSEH